MNNKKDEIDTPKGKPKATTDVDLYIGSRLRQLREKCGLSQTQLGEKVGVTFQQIQKYESGKNRIAVSRLLEFASALQASMNDFLECLEIKFTQAADGGGQLELSSEESKLIAAFRAVNNPKARVALLEFLQAIAEKDDTSPTAGLDEPT